MTLAEAVGTLRNYCKNTDCDGCVFDAQLKNHYCALAGFPVNWFIPKQIVETNIYDQEEIHKNCTVQILRNSVTGETSIGWWEDDSSNDMGAGRT